MGYIGVNFIIAGLLIVGALIGVGMLIGANL